MTPRRRWLDDDDDHPDYDRDTPTDPDRESLDERELAGFYDDVIYAKEDDHGDS